MLRRWVLFHIYSGDLLFTAAFLLLLAVVIGLVIDRRRTIPFRAARLLFLLSVPLAGLATVPVHPALAIALVLAWGTHAWIGFREQQTPASIVSGVLLILLTLVTIAPEILGRLQEPSGTSASTLVVLGDSISSGGFEEETTWVDLIGQTSELSTRNLSLPSETAHSALSTIDALEGCNGCGLVVELGGNEMLNGDSVDDHAANLRTLIARARNDVSPVWIVEIPPLPGHWAWAGVQRRVAKETGSTLIPRRVLAAVLADSRNTSDGLHLNDRGHRELAGKMRAWIAPDH